MAINTPEMAEAQHGHLWPAWLHQRLSLHTSDPELPGPLPEQNDWARAQAGWYQRLGGKRICELWGGDPVHPSSSAYRKIASDLDADLMDKEARYTNPVKMGENVTAKRQKTDDSLNRVSWVRGCPAALPRRDSQPGKPNWNPRGRVHRGSATYARPARGGHTPHGR